MLTKSLAIISTCILLTLLIACSEQAVTPSLTSNPDTSSAATSNVSGSGRVLWGYYTITIDRVTGEIETVPVRDIEGHYNVLKWLEKGPCTNCLKVTSASGVGTAYPSFDIEIKHPFSSPNLTGFDVRGVAIFDGTVMFPASGLIMSESTIGDFQVLSPDGLTALYSWWTAGKGPGGTQGYLKGKLSTPQEPKGTLNAFHTYTSNDPANTRNAFYAGDSITRTYDLYWPGAGTDKLVLGYAIDASWAPPTVKPVTDPMADFPPEANCPEPWKVTEFVVDDGLTTLGGQSQLEIRVYDHQGKDSYNAPYIECPYLFDGKLNSSWVADSADYSTYVATIINDKDAPEALYYVLVGVEDKDNSTSPDWFDLSAYSMVQVWVRDVEGWADTWGGPNGSDNAWDLQRDDEGNVYVAGGFYGDTFDFIDFDPGTGSAGKASNGKTDAFLSKFDSDGKYLWALTWGGTEQDTSVSVETSPTGVYVVGHYQDTVDFDPGTGVAQSTANGQYDCFVVAFDQDGNYLWHSTWGGSATDSARGVVDDPDNDDVFITGYYYGDVDFDPGPGVETHSAFNWTNAAFLTCYSTAGAYKWTKTWGGDAAGNSCIAESIDWDESNELYIAGNFNGTVDFDPGTGTTACTSNGDKDAYLCVFGEDGEHWWAKSWGADGIDAATDVHMRGGAYFVTGVFSNTVDFDPGTGTVSITANGGTDCFVSQFQYNGDFFWGAQWGGLNDDNAYGVAGDSYANVLYVVGDFQGIVDFDSEAGLELANSNGGTDIYLLNISTLGPKSFGWVRTFGGINNEYAYGVDTDSLGNALFCGSYWGTTDFDPEGNTGTYTSNGDYDIYVEKVLYTGEW